MLTIIFHKPYYYLAVPLLWCLFSSAAFAVGETTRVNVDSSGMQGNGEVDNNSPSVSADGRYVTFVSYANNLVAGDTNGWSDVFVHDRQTHQTTRVSVDSNGAQGDDISFNTSISADGRYVAFASFASNLVAGDTNIDIDTFVHDRLTHKTTRVSVDSNGAQGDYSSLGGSISADGRYVAFVSYASNLVAGDTNDREDIFVHDRQTHQTTRVSVASNGAQSDSSCYTPSISADGRYVAFSSKASNLAAGDTNGRSDIFVHDRQTHKTTRVSVASSGAQSNWDSSDPSISADGRYVAFSSKASNLVGGDTNSSPDIFVHDRLTHQTSLVSRNSKGVQGNSRSYYPSLSADGRHVAFASKAYNLIVGDTNGRMDVFVHDLWKHKTTRISRSSEGVQGNNRSRFPSISADGRYVAFVSSASNLVDGDTNNQLDIFVHDRTLITAYNADLQIKTTQQPPSLARNSTGAYTYTVTNQGPDTIYQARIVHLISNGRVVGFTPSQGSCRRYASISLCNLRSLSPGDSLTLNVAVKALRDPLSQQVSVSDGERADTAQDNNSVSVKTPVTP